MLTCLIMNFHIHWWNLPKKFKFKKFKLISDCYFFYFPQSCITFSVKKKPTLFRLFAYLFIGL